MLGGTFDPIHVGHLRAAIHLQEQLSLNQVRLMPAAIPPHRPAPWLDAATRLKLIALSIAVQPGLCVDDRELKRHGPSYSVDSIRALRAEHPEATIFLALGSDAFNQLPRWREPEALLALCHVVVLTRPGSTVDPHFPAHWRSGRITQLALPQLDISSTDIRARLQARLCVRFLMADAALDWLSLHSAPPTD